MKETNKARSAFEDYYQMGPGRSLSKLAEVYQSRPEASPTRSFRWLKRWSYEHGWQDRVRQRDEEIASAAMDELKEKAVQSGYALFFKRIADLNKLAEDLFENLTAAGKKSQYLSAIREFRALLADIASEMGERPTKLEIFDWRYELQQAGLSPGDEFEKLAQHFADLAESARPDDERGLGGGEAQDQ